VVKTKKIPGSPLRMPGSAVKRKRKKRKQKREKKEPGYKTRPSFNREVSRLKDVGSIISTPRAQRP